jgi:uncharacterized protein
MVGVTIGMSCSHNPTPNGQAQNEQHTDLVEANSRSITATPPLKRRCRGYYLRVAKPGEDNYDSDCYKLQSKLLTAALKGDVRLMKEAFNEGADPEGIIDDSVPALQLAAFGGHTDAVVLLLDKGADVNRVADFENTALNTAASEGRLEVIQVLLSRGADVCYGDKGSRAGDIAQARGHNELARLLKASENEKCKE